jgi:hypothetical protein
LEFRNWNFTIINKYNMAITAADVNKLRTATGSDGLQESFG